MLVVAPAVSAMAATRADASGAWRGAEAVTQVLGGIFLALPVHAGGLAVVDLHAVHAHVALSGFGVAGDDARERDEAAAVERPALEDGELIEREGIAENDFFAGRVFGGNGFGEDIADGRQLREHFEFFEEAFGGFDFEKRADAAGDFIEGALVGVEAEGELHAALGAELIDEDARAGKAFDVFEEEGGTACFGGSSTGL